MLIGLSSRFIFLASLKTASTAIEEVLGQYAEICLVESRFGKHMSFRQLEARFAWLFEEVPLKEFLIFGVIRDPIEFALSLYNSHTAEHFRDQPRLYTGDMPFKAFREVWVKRNHDEVLPQSNRFIGADGAVKADYIITYDRVAQGVNEVLRRLGLPDANLALSNQSPPGLTKSDLTMEDLNWCYQHFRQDYVFIERFGNKLPTSMNSEMT